MKVLYLNGADNEGGAAKAATRLLHGVRDLGADASMYVQRKSGDDPLVQGPRSAAARVMGFARPSLEENILGIGPRRRSGPFCAAFLPDRLLREVSALRPDILHLHWVARMMRLETLPLAKLPIVWTMHDSWPFTGGCYLPGDCSGYRHCCGRCPVLRSSSEADLSRRIWSRKREAWRGLELTLVAPSSFMAEQAKSSSLLAGFRIEVIPNGIDAGVFRPQRKESARESFGLPREKLLILFGAKGALSDRNKGFHLLEEALHRLSLGPLRDRFELVLFGAPASELGQELPFRTHYLGWMQDEATLALLYSAADLFVLPSLQESLGYTAMEALACGTPCVAFRQGGVPDLVRHQENGYLARPYQTDDLAAGIEWALEDGERRRRLAENARASVRQFALEAVAKRHVALYGELLGRSGSRVGGDGGYHETGDR